VRDFRLWSRSQSHLRFSAILRSAEPQNSAGVIVTAAEACSFLQVSQYALSLPPLRSTTTAHLTLLVMMTLIISKGKGHPRTSHEGPE